MRVLTLRRTGFAATVVTGVALMGTAVHGVSDMDTTLELAATPPERTTLVSDRQQPDPHSGGCPGERDRDPVAAPPAHRS